MPTMYDVERPLIIFQDRSVVREESMATHVEAIAPPSTVYAGGKTPNSSATAKEGEVSPGMTLVGSSMRTIIHLCKSSRNGRSSQGKFIHSDFRLLTHASQKRLPFERIMSSLHSSVYIERSFD